MQISGGSGGSSSSPIQLDISKTPADEGQTTYYGTSNNMMKVTKMNDVSVGGNFNFYIHSLLNGGKFTLSRTVKNNTTSLTLPDGDIENVYEVYYYVKTADNKGALKVKTSSYTKIFYNENITDNTKAWTKYDNKTNPAAFSNLFTTIKDDVEINVEKTTY